MSSNTNLKRIDDCSIGKLRENWKYFHEYNRETELFNELILTYTFNFIKLYLILGVVVSQQLQSNKADVN